MFSKTKSFNFTSENAFFRTIFQLFQIYFDLLLNIFNFLKYFSLNYKFKI